MPTVLSYLFLTGCALVCTAAVAVLFRALRLLRNPAVRAVKNTLPVLLLATLFLASCEKDPVTDGNAPVIETATLSQDTLILTGTFGPTPGTVVINGESLPTDNILTWEDDRIICVQEPPIPQEIVVEVIVDGRKSQPKIITLNNDFRITWLMVDEDHWKLYIFGHFGPDPGAGNRQVKVNGVVLGADNITEVEIWSPTLIVCIIPSTGPSSSGEVVVSKGANLSTSRILNEWKGEYVYTRPQHGNSGTLGERVVFNLTFRGDSGPMPPEAAQFASLIRHNFHDNCRAEYEAQGTANCSYDNEDGCASVHVSWDYTEGWLHVFPAVDWSGESHFYGHVQPVSGGYDIQIFFEAWEVTPSTITTYPCVGDSFTRTKKETIGFDAFYHDTIAIRFDGNKIKADKLSKHNLGSNGALTWDAIDVGNHFVTATLEWGDIAGKYQ